MGILDLGIGSERAASASSQKAGYLQAQPNEAIELFIYPPQQTISQLPWQSQSLFRVMRSKTMNVAR